MDPFDDDLNNFDLEAQLNQLDQLEDELRAEINMEIELDVVEFADQFVMDAMNAVGPGENDPQENLNQQEDQAAQGAQRQHPGEPGDPAPVNPGDEPVQLVAEGPPVRAGDDAGGGGNPAGGPEQEPDASKKPENDHEDPILTPAGAEMKGLACMICYDSFNTSTRVPKVFPCGHTFCIACVKGLMKNRSFLSSSTVICPTCRQNSRYSTSLGADKVPTNFCILAMLEQRKEEKIPKDEIEMLECKECHEITSGTEITICNENDCQQVNEESPKELDSLKRDKRILICRTCIQNNHSRHNFIPFNKIVAQYEANRKICFAEKALEKGLKYADNVLVALKLTETEVSDHRKRMANALVNIRAESDHPHIYEYLNKYMASVEASSDLFKRFTADMADFDYKSKARYYRAFGNDMLRPISISQRTQEEVVRPKEEPRENVANPPPRDRAQQAINRAQNRLARFNVFAPFPRNFFGNNEDGANQPDMPNIENMLDRVLDHLDVGRGFRNVPPMPPIVNLPVAAVVPGEEAPPGAEAPVNPDARDLRNPVGNRLDMWAVRAPILPRRFRRNENARELRAIRQNLVAAMAANPVLEGIPAIQQAIDGLRDREGFDDGPLGRRNIPAMDNDLFGREIGRAEDQLNRLRERLNRLEAVNLNPRNPLPEQNVPPAPWVDQIVEFPLAQLPPIDGIDQEVIQRAEINELVARIREMVRNEAHAEAVINGQPVPLRIEMPELLNPEAFPGVPDFNNLLPVQVGPFLLELRALELEWIQRGRDRRARAAAAPAVVPVQEQPPVAEPVANDQPDVPRNEEPLVQQNQEPVEDDDTGDRDLPRRENTPIPDEPAAKRVRH